jgi:hypothetical protein
MDDKVEDNEYLFSPKTKGSFSNMSICSNTKSPLVMALRKKSSLSEKNLDSSKRGSLIKSIQSSGKSIFFLIRNGGRIKEG